MSGDHSHPSAEDREESEESEEYEETEEIDEDEDEEEEEGDEDDLYIYSFVGEEDDGSEERNSMEDLFEDDRDYETPKFWIPGGEEPIDKSFPFSYRGRYDNIIEMQKIIRIPGPRPPEGIRISRRQVFDYLYLQEQEQRQPKFRTREEYRLYHRAARRDPHKFPKAPSEAGRALMYSPHANFGQYSLWERKPKSLSLRLLERTHGLTDTQTKINQGLMLQDMIPSPSPEMIIHYDQPVCCGQFSENGNFFYACVRDFRVRLYDTSNPYNWKHYKTFSYAGSARWTMTDAALSPDNKWLVSSSLASDVSLAPTDPKDTGDPYSLEFANDEQDELHGGAFAIFSVRFSHDGEKLVAGTSAGTIVEYDITRRQAQHYYTEHDDDINAVCYAGKESRHILFSGSDDCTIKIWDTRDMSDSRPASVLAGHTQGITYIDSKGDGRYILSNGKDQTMKLWDIRKCLRPEQYAKLTPKAFTRNQDYRYDYRSDDYDDFQYFRHPHDSSVVTFRGHKVQRTLIRCHFAPPGSADSRYVYSGSADGKVWIWNLDGTVKTTIDVKAATRDKIRAPAPNQYYAWFRPRRSSWDTVVRDVGWHPNAPFLVASSWNGPGLHAGTATLHGYNDYEGDDGFDPPVGRSLNHKLDAYQTTPRAH